MKICWYLMPKGGFGTIITAMEPFIFVTRSGLAVIRDLQISSTLQLLIGMMMATLTVCVERPKVD